MNMDGNVEETPFVKQLASGDRKTRLHALSLLSTYLTAQTSPLPFTSLLKIQKALFYTVHHTDRPLPQQQLAHTLADEILLRLKRHSFIPYLAAFWKVLIGYYSDIPSLRLDKYLYLVRCYVKAGFVWLERETGWRDSSNDDDDEEAGGGGGGGDLSRGWCDLMLGRGRWEGKNCGVLDCGDSKVPDGLRYHVLDVWNDGLMACERWEAGQKRVVGVVETVAKEGRNKILRQRAKGVLEDERLVSNGSERAVESEGPSGGNNDGDEEFSGFN